MNNLQYQKAKNEKTLSTLGNRAIGLEPINLSKCKRSSLLIDTETIGDITKGEKAYPYDIAFIQVKNGSIYHQISYINQDIFDNEYLMNNAFYKNKIPFYKKALSSDKRYIKKQDKNILEELNAFIKSNKITYFMAYNVKFDYNSINNLFELEKNKDIKNEFKKLYVIDIWKIATDIIKMFNELYEQFMIFCYKNNYITESGLNVQTGAECMNRFVNNDTTFEECHTGLEDTFCELNILQKMLWYYKKHTGLDYYYKLDSIFNPHGNVFKEGAFNVSHIPYILEKNNLVMA
jgi:hypothetical protein